MLNFGWWRDKDNREGAKTIVDVFKVVVPALVIAGGAIWGVLYASDSAKPPAQPTISVTTGDNSPVAIGDGNTQ
ncbi:MAG: hypothetical protein AAGH68_02855 [Pseudomonadota bacterium]